MLVGDVFTFVQKIENKTYVESLEFLAERANIKLPILSNLEDPQTKLKDRMFAIYADSTIFYHERLYKPLAKKAQEYVKQRKLNNAMLEQFKIGYSSENWDDLYKFLHNKGYSDKEIEATGLCVKSKRGNYIDFFRNRLMFPVMNVSGKVMAFGGRRLDNDDKSPKYLNSNDSLIFKKRENLFALNFARKSTSKNIILVEGYMDVISLHQRGIDTAVASLGTALTEGQGKLLRKYSDKIIFSYDSDEAGRNAILLGNEVLEKIGIEARVLQMERADAKDPDEYIIKYGSGRFKILMDNAISMIEYKTLMLRKQYDLENATDKIAFLREIAKLIAKIDSKVEREIYVDKIAKSNGISKEAIFADLNKLLYSRSEDSTKLLTKVNSSKPQEEIISNVSRAEREREKMMLYFLIKNYDEVGEKIVSKVMVEDFKVEKYKNIYNKILEIIKDGNNNIYNILMNIEDADFQADFSEIMFSEYEIKSVQKFTEDIINNYEKNKLNFRKNEILKLVSNKNLAPEESAKLMRELNELLIELAKMK
jgi:DNA primase